MADPLYEAVLLPPARRVFDELSENEHDEVWRLIQLIELDPEPDGDVKVVVYLPPVTFTLYTHPKRWIGFRISAPGRVSIDFIRPAWPPPAWEPAIPRR